VYSEYPGFRETRTVETDDPATTEFVAKNLAGFGHRDKYASSPTGDCPIRARGTPSQPFKRGAVWRQQLAPVVRGFDTEFTWQVSQHSRDCLQVKDAAFDGNLYSSCAVRGADGFAFVLHLDPNETEALGAGGGGIGYGGLRRALVVEFDTSYNPELGDSAPLDHVQIQARGVDPITADDVSRITGVAYTDVADGAVHRARLAYFPTVKTEWLASFTAAGPVRSFIRDEGEGRRVGTLALWIDAPSLEQAALNATVAAAYPAPTMAVPLNLGTLLQAPRSSAVVGFTAATGRSFERHDILSWRFCEQPGCARSAAAEQQKQRAEQRGDTNGAAGFDGPGTDTIESPELSGIDYHRESNA
jgi:hypothetical protein